MTFDMLVEVGLLREPMRTLFFNCKRASERTFACVDTQMVVEVMELTEVLVAVLVIAFEDF